MTDAISTNLPPHHNKDTVHLGDGLYASFDNYHIWLETFRLHRHKEINGVPQWGDSVSLGTWHSVALDPATVGNFAMWVSTLRKS